MWAALFRTRRPASIHRIHQGSVAVSPEGDHAIQSSRHLSGSRVCPFVTELSAAFKVLGSAPMLGPEFAKIPTTTSRYSPPVRAPDWAVLTSPSEAVRSPRSHSACRRRPSGPVPRASTRTGSSAIRLVQSRKPNRYRDSVTSAGSVTAQLCGRADGAPNSG
jgi:hypothetical protein